ncbi:MAG: CHASE domain-containing protein, partial [Blastopirellula sp. JB062]
MKSVPSSPKNSRASSTIDAAWLIIAARLLLSISFCASLLVLIAWPAGWIELRSVIEGLPTMKANTAIGLTLLSAAGLLRTMSPPTRGRCRCVSSALAVAAIAVVGVSFAEGIGAIDLGFNTLLSDDLASVAAGRSPGQMSHGTAMGILLLSLGLLPWRSPIQWCGKLCVLLGGVVGVAGVATFLIRATGLRHLDLYSTTAIHTALLLSTISVSILLAMRGIKQTETVTYEALVKKEIRRAIPLTALVALTLFVGFLVTSFLVIDSQKHIRNANYAKFHRQTELLTQEIQRRANLCVYGLKGARGMYEGSENVTRNEFAAYVASRNLPLEFPGAIGFGMIQRVNRDEIDQFVAAERSDNAPDYQIRSLGKAPIAYVIQHIYPLAANRPAWGFDVGSEQVRRTAIEQAIRTGAPTISGMIHLLQDDVKRSGFLYLVPIYRNGSTPQTAEQYEAELAGILYAPIILERSLEKMGHLIDDGLDFEIFDGRQLSRSAQLYDHDRHLDEYRGTIGASAYAERLFTMNQPITVGGRTWTITTSTTEDFEANVDRVTPAVFGIGGAALSMLLAGIVWSMGLSRMRAMALAEDMTRELRASEKMATLAAQEAERLAKIIRRTSNGVIISDIEGKIEWVNDGFTRLSGYRLEEAIGKTPGELLHGPKSDPKMIARMKEAIRLRSSTTAEIVNYAKDGREYVVAAELAPLN